MGNWSRNVRQANTSNSLLGIALSRPGALCEATFLTPPFTNRRATFTVSNTRVPTSRIRVTIATPNAFNPPKQAVSFTFPFLFLGSSLCHHRPG
jgi:hypothetical protein